MTRTFAFQVVGAALFALLFAATIAVRPADAASLRPSVIVTSDIVTLGDLFADAGTLADRPVFRSPDPGVEGALSAETALTAARLSGLDVDPTDIRTVRVVREATMIDAATIRMMLADETARRFGIVADDVVVTLDSEPETIAANPRVAMPARLEQLTVAPGGGRFRAAIVVDLGATVTRLQLAGTVLDTIELPILQRPLARGAIVSDADIALQRVERRRLRAGVALDPDEILGMAVRRALRAGEPVTIADLEAPKVVRRGEEVTLVYIRKSLILSARGRALEDAAAGEIVPILNEQSRRTVQGVAVSPGRVEILAAEAAPAAPQSPVLSQ